MSSDLLKQRRFQKPKDFHFNFFEREERKIRYGSFIHKNSKALIILLPGMGEYIEKYYETARNFKDAGYNCIILDWYGQGGSGRYLDNQLKRHGGPFEEDIADLHILINEHIKTDLPLIMLGHSMGGNIGLRYLAAHPDIFKAAIFTAPMCGIQDITLLPHWFQSTLSNALNMTIGESFTSGHGGSALQQRDYFDGNILSGDPERFALHTAWFGKEPKLKIGDVTFGWVNHAIHSCHALEKEAQNIKTPCFFALAEKERIVDNKTTLGIIERIKNAQTHIFEHAQHELMMESDDVRAPLLEKISKFIETYL